MNRIGRNFVHGHLIKVFLALAMALIANRVYAQQALRSSFLPPNLAHFEDQFQTDNGISQEILENLRLIGLQLFSHDAEKIGLKLSIHAEWNNSTVNAYMQRQAGKMIVYLHGGLARRPELSPVSLAGILCHELGHGLGGHPARRHPLFHISAEGQADYYAFGECLDRMLTQMAESFPGYLLSEKTIPAQETEAEDFSLMCQELQSWNEQTSEMDSGSFGQFCEEKLRAGLELGMLLANLRGEPEFPSYSTPDTSLTPRTLLGYPKTSQCRLDTFAAAIQKRERPWCWFAP